MARRHRDNWDGYESRRCRWCDRDYLHPHYGSQGLCNACRDDPHWQATRHRKESQ